MSRRRPHPQLYRPRGGPPTGPGPLYCADDIDDARRVSETLGISHTMCSRLRGALPQGCHRPFALSYVHGETPIPCVACSQTVKFADLLRPRRNWAPTRRHRPLHPPQP